MNDERLDHDEGLDPETSELLASEEPGADFPRDAIRERIRASVARRQAVEPATLRRSPWLKVGGAIAASLVIFVAGARTSGSAGSIRSAYTTGSSFGRRSRASISCSR